MKSKSNKLTLIMAIVITIVFCPMAVIGTYLHIKYPKDDTPKCDITLPNGTCYICTNKSGYCNYALNYLADDKYALNYYKESINYVIASGDYVFMMDTATNFSFDNYLEYPQVTVYNSIVGNKLQMAGLNNYGIGLANNYYIGIDNTGKYGLFRIDAVITKTIDYMYDFIGVANHIENQVLDSSKLVVLENGIWKIIDPDNNPLSKNLNDPIYDYGNYAIALRKDNQYSIVDYDGIPLLPTNYTKIFFYHDIVLLINESNILTAYNTYTRNFIGEAKILSTENSLEVKEQEDSIDIYIDGVAIQRIFFDGRISDVPVEEINNNLTS